jgi:5-methyltetrahydrofolate--homocysteine methyltransferase
VTHELDAIYSSVLNGEANKVRFMTEVALGNGIAPNDILEQGLLKPLGILGEKLKNNQVFIAEVIVVSRAVHAGLHVLEPYLEKGDVSKRGIVVIGTVAGDLHDIGKNLVAMTLASLGWEVIDLGIDVYPEDFVEAVEKYKPEYVAISAMLTTTINEIGNVLDALEDAGLRRSVKVIIGGNPITSDFCFTVGADGTCREVSEIGDMMKYIDQKTKKKM